MKLVIDIPEETVNEIKDNVMFACSIPSDIRWDVTSAIANGIPLSTDAVDRETIREYMYCLGMGIKVTTTDDVLDKIRAEIDSHCSDNRDRNDGLYIAMKIIDKYKAGGSDKV